MSEKRRTRKRIEQLDIDGASRKLGQALAVYAPKAAYDLGLAKPPKPKRTAPRVAAGVVIGAGAVYFLEPRAREGTPREGRSARQLSGSVPGSATLLGSPSLRRPGLKRIVVKGVTMYETIQNDTITVGAFGVRFLVEAADSNGTAAVFECYVPANSRMPVPHSHDGFEETVYGLQGVTTWTIDGQSVELGPGEAVCVQRGQIHGFQNHGDVDATFLAVATPALFGPAYFREISEVLAASAGGPPNLATIEEVMRRHGLTPAPPNAV